MDSLIGGTSGMTTIPRIPRVAKRKRPETDRNLYVFSIRL